MRITLPASVGCLVALVSVCMSGTCPEQVAIWPYGPAETVLHSEPYTYVGSGPTLLIVNFDEPASPEVVGEALLPGIARALAVSGDFVYVAVTTGWLVVVDVSDPTDPSVIGRLSTGDYIYSYQVVVDGDIAYVNASDDHDDYVLVVDILDPSAPVEISRIEVRSEPTEIIVSDGVAYLSDAGSLLETWNISNPSQPVLLARLTDDYMSFRGIALKNGLIFAAADDRGWAVVDCSNPTQPNVLNVIQTNTRPQGIKAGNDLIYVLDDNRQLEIFDVSNIGIPLLLSSTEIHDGSSWSGQSSLVGHKLFVAAGSDGIRIINVQFPASPYLMGQLTTPGPSFQAKGLGDFLYISESLRVRVFDSSNLVSGLVEVGSIEFEHLVNGIAVDGTHLLVASDDLYIFEVSNPSSPRLVGQFSCLPAGVAVRSNLAFVPDREIFGIRILDISDSSQPVEIGSIELGTYSGLQTVLLADDLAHLISGGNLMVLDIADPGNPILVGHLYSPGDIFSAIAKEPERDRLFVVRDSVVTSVDVSDPSSPTIDDEFQETWSARGVEIHGGYLIVAGGHNGVAVYDRSAPSRPAQLGRVGTRGRGSGATSHGDHLFLADGSGGVVAFSTDWCEGARSRRSGGERRVP